MKYQEFIEKMKQTIENEVGDGYQVEVRKVPGLNGQEKTGLTIAEKAGKNRIVPVIYLEEIYELFLQEEDLVPCVRGSPGTLQGEKAESRIRRIAGFGKPGNMGRGKEQDIPHPGCGE